MRVAGSATVGLFNPIMFPTIFICMAIVGGAIVLLLTGVIADLSGLRTALLVPLVGYVIIAGFAMACRRPGAGGEGRTKHG